MPKYVITDNKNATTDLKSFHYLESGEVTFSQVKARKSVHKLDPGSYRLDFIENYPESRVYLTMNKDIECPKIHSFPCKEQIDGLFESFFDENVRKKINNLGFYHKVGLLLYGKEGTGKSTIFKHYYSKAIDTHQCIVFHMVCVPNVLRRCWEFIMKIRKIQNNPIIVVFEELDEFNKEEGLLKVILDGSLSIDNCMFMASTNYIDSVANALKERGSRFKYSINLEGMSEVDDIEHVMMKMIGDFIPQTDVRKYAEDMRNSTLDMVKQFCLDKIMHIKDYSKKKSTIGFR